MIQASLFFSVGAQVLNVNNNQQLYDQWCWAASSKTVLDYYGFVKQQCDIAEWVRTTATFHNYGSVNCCTDATQGCNYWNYNYGSAGSIQDILIHFGNLQNTGANPLTLTEIATEIKNNRLFIIRWGWSTGGGHFIVGHGISGNNIYFMNPWFGEGLHIGTFSFMLSGVDNTNTATHTWTATNKITSNITGVNELSNEETISVYPNPFFSETTLQSDKIFKDATLAVYNSCGQQVKQIKNISGRTIILHRDNLPSGLYFIRLTQDNKKITTYKLVITDN
ncbi:MAG TPA: T9SS type A sorting domain-containing protein [Ignavibacteria bacterium]